MTFAIMRIRFVLLFFFIYSYGSSYSQQLLRTLQEVDKKEILSIDINRNGTQLLSGGTTSGATLWDTEGEKIEQWLGAYGRISEVLFIEKFNSYVLACYLIALMDGDNFKSKKMFKGHSKQITSLAFDPVNNVLMSTSEGNKIKLWNLKTLEPAAVFKGHEDVINQVVFTPDGKYFVSISADNTIKIHDSKTATTTKSISTGSQTVNAISISNDGKYIASILDNKSIVFWDFSGNKKGSLSGHNGKVKSLAFSPDAKYIASAGDDGKIIFWDINKKEQVSSIQAHNDPVTAIKFCENGKTLISASLDKSIKIWDLSELNIGKKIVPKNDLPPKLVTSSIKLEEAINNGIIEFKDDARLTFNIENQGEGIAYDIEVKVSLNENIEGMSFSDEIYIGTLGGNQKTMVAIPIHTNKNIKTASGTFNIDVSYLNANKSNSLKFNFQTKKSESFSSIIITDYTFSSATGKSETGVPITLKLKLKNTSKKVVPEIKVQFTFPENVLAVDKLSQTVSDISPEREKEISVDFYANKKFTDEDIKIEVNIEGADFTNAGDLDIRVKMNEKFSEKNEESPKISFNEKGIYISDGKESITIGKDGVSISQNDNKTSDISVLPREEPTQYRGSGDPLKGLNVSKAEMKIGNYYALIIGIDNYQGEWAPLNNAVRDAKSIEDLFKRKYKFDQFRTLYNELATRKNVMKEFDWLVQNVSENDNVFIYYSGHGEFKKELNRGYWVPIEAQTTETYEFISNSDIQTFLNGIKSKHTLLVSDACFSGDIFRGTTISVPFEESSIYYKKVHTLKSRQAFTSGGIEPVLDGGREGHSVFAYYFLEMLKRNEDKYYDAGQLYNDMKIPVTNNSDQTPLLQPVKNTGDEGGQFIFIKK